MNARRFWTRAALAVGLYWAVLMWLLGQGIVFGIILGVIQMFITLLLGGMAIGASEADDHIEKMMQERLEESNKE